MSKFNWEESGPSEAALDAFNYAVETDFPDTYSGMSWLACFRLWKRFKDNPPEFLDLKEAFWDERVLMVLHGMGLSGFMVGWACNALRQMWGCQPGINPAICTIDEKGNIEREPHASIGPAQTAAEMEIKGETFDEPTREEK